MSETKITDLVPQETIDKIKELNTEIQTLLTTYTNTAKELAKGVDVNVKVIGDIDKLEKLLVEKSKEATVATERLNAALAEQSQVVANTTNTISRQLMEQERVNKTQREAYTEHEKVKKLLDQYHDTYDGQLQRLIKINRELEQNKKAQKENDKALSMGSVSMSEFTAKQADLIARHRSLTQEKRTLTQIMSAEEKAAQSQEGSYAHMSQQLELLKKAYKDLSDEGRNSDLGKELETSIQNLDAHLKDVAADMGEFQRNVGNYAIAGQNGVVSTESLMTAINRQATTTKDLVDQNKILMEARSMLDTSDKNYANTIALINDKLTENSRKLNDVSDIINVQATSIAEAEAQNKRLIEALKQIDLSSEDAEHSIQELNAKIEENNNIIQAGNESKTSIKKDLKELVLEIANLSIEYQNLSEEEKASSNGQALASHIQELTERAGVLKDAIADTNQAITNAASDTRGFDQLSGSIKLAIDGFGLASGAAEMLGIRSGDLASIQTKLQAAIAASNAMQSIQNTLQKQSAVMQGAALIQTKLRTIAENLHTSAQGKGVVATKAATIAQWAFNQAAAANPIGIIVTVIVACIAAVVGLTKAFNAFVSDSAERKKAYERECEALEKMKRHHEQATELAKARGASETEVSLMVIEARKAEMDQTEKLFLAAKNAYDTDEQEFIDALENKKQAHDDYITALNDGYNEVMSYIQQYKDYEREQEIGSFEFKKEKSEKSLAHRKQILHEQYRYARLKYDQLCVELEAQFGVSAAKTTAMYQMAVQQINIINKQFEKNMADLSKAQKIEITKLEQDEKKRLAQSHRVRTSSARKSVTDAKNAAKELKKAVEAGENALLEIIADSLERKRQVEILSYNRKYKELQEQLNKTKNSEIKMREALNNQILGLKAEHNRKLEEIEIAGSERRLKAEADVISSHLEYVKEGSKEEYEWKQKLLNNQYSAELFAIQKSQNEQTITVEQAEEMRINLALKYYNLREKAEEEHASNMVGMIEKRYATEQIKQDNAYISKVNSLKKQYAAELAEAKGNVSKQEAIKTKFEQEQARAAEEYAQQKIRTSINMLEEVLKNEKLSAEDRLKFEQRLANAKIELDQQIADAYAKRVENQITNDNELRAKRVENIQYWLQKAGEAMSAINDLMGAVFDGQIEKLEASQEANEKASQAEQEHIVKLVEQNVITEEEGEARKRAAEERTAKKTEELEKKKAQIKHKQAIFDKALSVANIGLNTAMALMQLWVKPGWPAAIPMMTVVGALGALQLATVLATPIPKYAKGTDYHRGGPAIVGDGGKHEVVVFGGNSWITPDKPTLVNIPEGASVIPDILEYDDNIPSFINVVSGADSPRIIVNNDYKKLEEKMDRVIFLFRKLNDSRREDETNNYLELIKLQKGL